NRLIPVGTPTHVCGLLEFDSGALATLVTSFDVPRHQLPHLEIYGTDGTLSAPDPNTFGGRVRLWRNSRPTKPGHLAEEPVPDSSGGIREEWEEVPLDHPANGQRGLGVADLARAMLSGRPHRANAETAYHVLDVLLALLESATAQRHI